MQCKCLQKVSFAGSTKHTCMYTYKTLYTVIPSRNVWEHSTCSDMALSVQHQQPSTSSCSPYHSYKLCLLANRRADSPAVAWDKSWPVQASNSIEAGWLVILHLVFIILSLSSGMPPLKLILFKLFLACDGAGEPFWRCVSKLWIIFGEIHLHVETWVMF
jgi:hypothetical protein